MSTCIICLEYGNIDDSQVCFNHLGCKLRMCHECNKILGNSKINELNLPYSPSVYTNKYTNWSCSWKCLYEFIVRCNHTLLKNMMNVCCNKQTNILQIIQFPPILTTFLHKDITHIVMEYVEFSLQDEYNYK